MKNCNGTKQGIETVISTVDPGSLADKKGILPGDRLVSINGKQIEDVIDFRFESANETVDLIIERPDKQCVAIRVKKNFDEELGLQFRNPVLSKTKFCHNQCVFCFIDQMPPGMRNGLYEKDDDTRLSFLQGNYVTLTNLSDADIDKIIAYRMSPINISIHTTNPELRKHMLGNERAGKIYDQLKKFHSAGLRMNLQIVLCPGMNDDVELDRTFHDISMIASSVISVAVVPVGLTRFQKNSELVAVDHLHARKAIEKIEGWQQTFVSLTDRKVVYPSDELYRKAGLPHPKAMHYDGFFQLENGVGMMASFEESMNQYLRKMPCVRKKKHAVVSVATGKAAEPFITEMSSLIRTRINPLTIQIFAIENRFFGDSIDVSGLITGKDLIDQMKDKHLGNALMIPENMLKSDEEVFLDDLTLGEVEKQVGTPIIVCEVSGEQWIRKLLRASK